MKKLALFGPIGMLGSAVYSALHEKYKLILVLRDVNRLTILNDAYGGVNQHRSVFFDSDALQKEYTEGFPSLSEAPTWQKLIAEIGEIHGVVNCIGVTNRFSQQQPLVAYFINSAFPHLLAQSYGSKLIHITTDCVFNGNAGAPYTEDSMPSPTDLYGLTKMLGEPMDRSLVLRTSIIGPEISGFVSLVEWVRKQDGQVVKGFNQHHWNGITTLEFGKIVDRIFSHRSDYPRNGLFHIYSTDVTKHDMIVAIAKKYHVDVTVTPTNGPRLDRRLRTVKDLNGKLQIPPFGEMLRDLPELSLEKGA